LLNTPAVKPDALKWAALVGTWGHKGAEKAMRWHNKQLDRERWLVERRAHIDDELVPGGSTDVFDVDNHEVVDWKFIGESSMTKYKRHGPPGIYVVQAMLYGLGWMRMGRTVHSVRIIFLPRWSNELVRDGWEWAAPYDERTALDALARLHEIQAKANLAAGGLLPWADIPRDTTACRFCPWHDAGKTSGEPDASGCAGWSKPRADLAELGGVTTAAHIIGEADGLTIMIRRAPTLQALNALWKSFASTGEWTQAHTNEAKQRKVALAST